MYTNIVLVWLDGPMFVPKGLSSHIKWHKGADGSPTYVRVGYQRYNPSLRVTRRQGGGRARRTVRDYVNRKGTWVQRRKDHDGVVRGLRTDGVFPELPISCTVRELPTSRPIETIAASRLLLSACRDRLNKIYQWAHRAHPKTRTEFVRVEGNPARKGKGKATGYSILSTDIPVNMIPAELMVGIQFWCKGCTKGF